MRTSVRWSGHRGSRLAALTAAVAGCAVAAMVGLAMATTYTVQMARSSVSQGSGSSMTEKIAVNSKGFALYELTGDSKTHQECTSANHCFQFWPPATVKGTHVTKAPAVPGKLGTWKRDGFIQLTLNGHPLYRYTPDVRAHSASGQGVKSFGGTWHVITSTKSSSGGGGGGGGGGWG